MKELLREKGLWESLLLCIATLFIGFPFDNIQPPRGEGSFLKLYQETLDTQMVLFLLPIAASLPMGAIYVKESSAGFLRLYITRISRMEYIRKKTLQIYASGFLPFFLAGMLGMLLSFLALYPLEIQGAFPWEGMSEAGLMLLRISLAGGILAEISGVFAALSRNYYMAYGLPFVCYYMLVILKERYFTKMYAMYPAEWIRCAQDWGVDGLGIWVFLAAFSISVMLLHGLLLYRCLSEI